MIDSKSQISCRFNSGIYIAVEFIIFFWRSWNLKNLKDSRCSKEGCACLVRQVTLSIKSLSKVSKVQTPKRWLHFYISCRKKLRRTVALTSPTFVYRRRKFVVIVKLLIIFLLRKSARVWVRQWLSKTQGSLTTTTFLKVLVLQYLRRVWREEEVEMRVWRRKSGCWRRSCERRMSYYKNSSLRF